MKRILALAVIFLLLGTAALHAAPQGKTYKYGLWNMMGNQSTQYSDLIKKFVNLVFTKMGEKVQIVDMSKEQAYKAIDAKTIDFTTLLQVDYVEMANAGKNVHPVVTAAPLGHVKEYKCIITPKSDTYSKLADMKGKRFAQTHSLGDYYGNRWLLGSKGADAPLDRFFSQVLVVPDDALAIQAVADGKADVSVVTASTMNFLRFAGSPALKKIKEAECIEFPWPGAPLVWVGKPDPVALKKLYDTMGQLETFPEFKQIKPLLNILKMRLNFVTDRDYDGLLKMHAQGKKNGWSKEYERIAGSD